MRQILPKAIDIVFEKELPEVDAHVVLRGIWLLQSPGEAPRCDLKWDHGVFKGAEGEMGGRGGELSCYALIMVVDRDGFACFCLSGLDCFTNAWNVLVKECGEESRYEALIFHNRAGRYLV